uniref:General transcription factor IIA, 1-like n=1 Tax=Labrus bergylta TaxID=56723 RepID=A0A3Q3M0K9_9LABR
AKLYLSIIDDVIESMRELFLDEGLEDRVLDDLRHLWESKMMQSKAMEDFRKNNINSSNFVLQLPASYTQTDQDVTQAGSETLATFSLPAGLAYPVQIPAGVTLQTASQLYKVNVPVVVTQQPVSQPAQKVTAFRGAAAPQPAAAPPKTAAPPQEVDPSPAPAASVTQQPPQNANLPPSQETSALQQPPGPAPETSLPQTEPEVPQVANEPSPHPEPSYSDLSDIVQLDGAADNSDLEEDEGGVPLEENDFLGIINAEAIKALQEEKQDPLNSGDDVMEQDIPDLFDTDNVIVCQYDKIHRSKNRWKFHLKDGVMCYGGRDYVFSKAVGEAEW